MRTAAYSSDHSQGYSATVGNTRGLPSKCFYPFPLPETRQAPLLQKTLPRGPRDAGLNSVPAKLTPTRNVRMGQYLGIGSLWMGLVKMRSHWSRVGSNPRTGVFIRTRMPGAAWMGF